MNGDPYRGNQPAERQVVNRAATPARTVEPQYKEEPRVASRSSSRRETNSDDNRRRSRTGLWVTLAIAAIVLAVLGVIGYVAWQKSASADTGIDSSRLQVIFLEGSGQQIFIGKLTDYSDDLYKMTNVYYPQVATTESASDTESTTASGLQLNKLTKDVIDPEDAIYIRKDQVLYYENLTANSRVTQKIGN